MLITFLKYYLYMRNFIFTQFITLSLLFLSVGNAFSQQDSTTLKVYATDEFEIQYQPSWELNSSGMAGTKFVLLSALSSSNDKFRENVNLVNETVDAMTLAEYSELSLAGIKKMITNAKIFESSTQSLQGVEFQRIIFSGKQGEYNLKFMQYYFIKNGKAYVLTYTGEKDQFEDFKTVAEVIMNSFVLK